MTGVAVTDVVEGVDDSSWKVAMIEVVKETLSQVVERGCD